MNCRIATASATVTLPSRLASPYATASVSVSIISNFLPYFLAYASAVEPLNPFITPEYG